MHRPEQNGFTLFEILIALVVFSIVALITSSVLYSVFNTKERLASHADRLAELQIAMTLLQRDFTQCTARPVNTPQQQLKPEMVGQVEYVEFTTAGNVNPLNNQHRSSLTRVAYLVKAGQLIRRTWESLDTKQVATHDKVILRQLDSLEFHYLDAELHLAPNTTILPIAVQINLNLHQWGKMSLLFAIPIGADNASSSLT